MIILVMGGITLYKDRTLFSDYENSLINKYATWEEELNTKKQELEQWEQELLKKESLLNQED